MAKVSVALSSLCVQEVGWVTEWPLACVPLVNDGDACAALTPVTSDSGSREQQVCSRRLTAARPSSTSFLDRSITSAGMFVVFLFLPVRSPYPVDYFDYSAVVQNAPPVQVTWLLFSKFKLRLDVGRWSVCLRGSARPTRFQSTQELGRSAGVSWGQLACETSLSPPAGLCPGCPSR